MHNRLEKFAIGAVLTMSLTGFAGASAMAATPPDFVAPDNLAASVNGNVVTLTWEIPASGSEVAMWDVGWADMETGVPTNGWGIWVRGNEVTATVTVADDTSGDGPARFSVRAGNGPCIGEGTGDCVYGPAATVDVNIDSSAVTPVATDVTVVMSATGATEAPAEAISAESEESDGDGDEGGNGMTIAIIVLGVGLIAVAGAIVSRSRQTKSGDNSAS